MTDEQIEKLEAGTKLDELVALHLFGWKSETVCDGTIGEQHDSAAGWVCLKCGTCGYWGDDEAHTLPAPHYSTDIADSWKVVERIRSFYPRQGLTIQLLGFNENWLVSPTDDDIIDNGQSAEHSSICVAICHCALRIVPKAHFLTTRAN